MSGDKLKRSSDVLSLNAFLPIGPLSFINEEPGSDLFPSAFPLGFSPIASSELWGVSHRSSFSLHGCFSGGLKPNGALFFETADVVKSRWFPLLITLCLFSDECICWQHSRWCTLEIMALWKGGVLAAKAMNSFEWLRIILTTNSQFWRSWKSVKAEQGSTTWNHIFSMPYGTEFCGAKRAR